MCLLVLFVMWTIAVCFVDVKAIGPQGSSVGFATLNSFFHNLTGVHMSLYIITDWLSIAPFCFVLGFAVLGLIQWIRRKRLSEVDYSIFILGGFYVVVFAVYVLFEVLAINYRPILIDGYLEVSYPSSTTMLVMCVMLTAMMQLNLRIKNKMLRRIVAIIIAVFTIFMVIARLVSGVHWLTDIIGSGILSAGLVMLYYSFVSLKRE